ncbi:MAG: neutral/alkaline non-lysosomal ceramidase N-terminal domain-containing protein [Candidatus Aminicenantaceae bacterium]
MMNIGTRQFEKAKDLYKNAVNELTGKIDYRHSFVKFSNLPIHPRWVKGKEDIRTCPPAIGFSKIAGSTEDGIGIEFIPEGMTFDNVILPKITLVPELQECHKEKRILIPIGDKEPFYLTQEILPVQIMTLGNLALLAVPFECTTMSGRRLKTAVKDELVPTGIKHIIIAGYSNAYTGYVTTREEYKAQHYEGASTHFGPYTLNAYQQEFNKLAKSMNNGENVNPGPIPPDLSDKQKIKQIGVLFDLEEPPSKKFGAVYSDASSSYRKGQIVRVVFWGAHPRNNLKIQDTYLTVEYKSGDDWIPVVYDWNPETIYRWERSGLAQSKITIEWTIPQDEDFKTGEYRIRHFGHWKSFWSKEIISYSGTSRTFRVTE